MHIFDFVVGKPFALRRSVDTVPGSTIAQQPPNKSCPQSESNEQPTNDFSVGACGVGACGVGACGVRACGVGDLAGRYSITHFTGIVIEPNTIFPS